MGNKHDGGAIMFLDRQQIFLSFVADDRVKRTEWLIHQEDCWIGCQSTGNANTLLLTA